MQTTSTENPMQLIAEDSMSDTESKMEYLIDRDELLHLREEKLAPTTFYVYLAIKLTYSHSQPNTFRLSSKTGIVRLVPKKPQLNATQRIFVGRTRNRIR